MKKLGLLSLVLLVSLAGCGGKRRSVKTEKRKRKSDVNMNIDIPVAQDGIRSFFDEDMQEFTALEQSGEVNPLNVSIDELDFQNDVFAWANENNESKDFKVVNFDFNSYSLQKDQEEKVAYNIAQAKKMVEESKFFGDDAELPLVVIEGHACHSAGSRVYNLALSELRAKVLADKFIEAGIPQECIKIVGRGSEIPVTIDGKQVTGDRAAQAPNRRDEIRVIYS